MMEEIWVSIWCVTYNHEQYIRETLEGFLAQETDFKYEIIVHDDASTDRTATIAREYEEEYPNLIHVICQTENQTSKNGTDRSWLWFIQARYCKGKYIAFCEGDDYWTDPCKLQIQINYMEQNPECVLTAHDAVLMNAEKNEEKAMRPYETDKDISADEIIMQYHGMLPTASMIFRKDALKEDFYQYFLGTGVGDYPLQLWMMTKGKIHYFSRLMSVYRYMHQGSWNERIITDFKSTAVHTVHMIQFLKKFDKYTGRKYQNSITRRIEKYEKSMLPLYCQSLSLEFFERTCELYDMETNDLYHEEFEGLKKQFNCTFHTQMDELFEDIRQFCLKYRHIYIMGAGNFGAAIAGQLKYQHLDFEGFIISDNVEKGKTYMDKPVWSLKQLSCSFEDTGIIIGVNLEKWTDVIKNLEKTGIKNYLVSLMLKCFIKNEN